MVMVSETNVKGELACLKLELRAIEKNAIVSRPTVECVYDRLVDHDGKIHRVQVKYAGCKASHCDGAIKAYVGRSCEFRGKHVPYDGDELDAIVLYLPDVDKILWLEKAMWLGKVNVQLRYTPPKNNQTKGIHLVENHLW